jgi:hypothetical protein
VAAPAIPTPKTSVPATMSREAPAAVTAVTALNQRALGLRGLADPANGRLLRSCKLSIAKVAGRLKHPMMARGMAAKRTRP